jgi:archaellum biogenesis ATPase FlaH
MIKGNEVLGKWYEELRSVNIIRPWDCGMPVLLKPRMMIGIGGEPGVGKTAFVNQICFDALENNQELKLVICNVEMSIEELLERELARKSKVAYEQIQPNIWTGVRNFTKNEDSIRMIEAGKAAMAGYLDRVWFIQPPFSYENLEEACEESAAELVVVDYLQRLITKKEGNNQEKITELMSKIRNIAMTDRCVLVLAALNRKGYKDLELSSFRDCSEIEYGCDSAYLMSLNIGSGCTEFKHVKHRYTKDLSFIATFKGKHQMFEGWSYKDALEMGKALDMAKGGA